jgi:hypothetical protein
MARKLGRTKDADRPTAFDFGPLLDVMPLQPLDLTDNDFVLDLSPLPELDFALEPLPFDVDLTDSNFAIEPLDAMLEPMPTLEEVVAQMQRLEDSFEPLTLEQLGW